MCLAGHPHAWPGIPARIAPPPAPPRASLLCAAQSVYELSDGSGLVLTVGKYVTPLGTDIDREGLKPEFRSPPSAEAVEGALRACRLQRAAAAPSLAQETR